MYILPIILLLFSIKLYYFQQSSFLKSILPDNVNFHIRNYILENYIKKKKERAREIEREKPIFTAITKSGRSSIIIYLLVSVHFCFTIAALLPT